MPHQGRILHFEMQITTVTLTLKPLQPRVLERTVIRT